MPKLTPVKRSDPFELPKGMVPPGLTYQWVAETICGDHNPQYDTLCDAGWVAVPAQWHQAHFKGQYGPVKLCGQVLMCHAAAKDEEAERIAGAARNLDTWAKNVSVGGFSGGVRMIVETPAGMGDTYEVTLGEPKIANRVTEPLRLQAAQNIAPQPDQPPLPVKTRVARHRALTWLFNLISVEQ